MQMLHKWSHFHSMWKQIQPKTFSLSSPSPPLSPLTPTNPSVSSLQDHPEGFLNSQYQMSCKDEYKNNTS